MSGVKRIEVYFKTKAGKPIFYILQTIGILLALVIVSEESVGFLGWIIVQLVSLIIVYFVSHLIDLLIFSIMHTENTNVNIGISKELNMEEKYIKIERLNKQISEGSISREQYEILLKNIIK